jgi:hypothetical protein
MQIQHHRLRIAGRTSQPGEKVQAIFSMHGQRAYLGNSSDRNIGTAGIRNIEEPPLLPRQNPNSRAIQTDSHQSHDQNSPHTAETRSLTNMGLPTKRLPRHMDIN